MGELVKLPTAAPRKVYQPTGKVGTAALRAYREANPWPGEFMWPGERELQRKYGRKERGIAGLTQTPELAILLCLVKSLPEQQIVRALAEARIVRAILPDDMNFAAAEAVFEHFGGKGTGCER